MLPIEYQDFVLMDILHLTPEQIKNLEGFEYLAALNYAWVVFNLRKTAYTDKKGRKIIDSFKTKYKKFKNVPERTKNQIIEFDHKFEMI